MESHHPVKCSCQNTCSRAAKRNQHLPLLQKMEQLAYNVCQCDYGNVPCSNKHGGDDLPVLEQTDDGDASFDNNNYGTDVSYVLIV